MSVNMRLRENAVPCLMYTQIVPRKKGVLVDVACSVDALRAAFPVEVYITGCVLTLADLIMTLINSVSSTVDQETSKRHPKFHWSYLKVIDIALPMEYEAYSYHRARVQNQSTRFHLLKQSQGESTCTPKVRQLLYPYGHILQQVHRRSLSKGNGCMGVW